MGLGLRALGSFCCQSFWTKPPCEEVKIVPRLQAASWIEQCPQSNCPHSFSLVTIAVMITMSKGSLERKELILFYDFQMTLNHWEKSERGNLEAGTLSGDAAYWLASPGLLSLLFYILKWAGPHQNICKVCPLHQSPFKTISGGGMFSIKVPLQRCL